MFGVQVWTLIFLGDMGAHWFMYNPAKKSELWRLLTYMAVHTGPIHLALNVVIQCLLAWPLETEQTTCRVAVLYFAGGIAGSLISRPTLINSEYLYLQCDHSQYPKWYIYQFG